MLSSRHLYVKDFSPMNRNISSDFWIYGSVFAAFDQFSLALSTARHKKPPSENARRLDFTL
jgi:hypothetical protein